jgi:hypothetical protein
MPRHKGKWIREKWMDIACQIVQENARFVDMVGYTVSWDGRRFTDKECTYELTKKLAAAIQKQGFV